MLACRKLFILLVTVLIALTALIGLAQDNKLDRLVEEKKEREATVGVLTYDSIMSNGTKLGTWYLVDLTLRDKETNAPFLYLIGDHGYPLKEGRTYKAHMVNGEVHSIVINGVPVAMQEYSMGATSTCWVCNERPSPEGGHWERTSPGNFTCKPGVKETINWKADKGSKQETARSGENKNIPPCDQMGPFHDTILTVVITVKPAAGLKWTFADAPSMVAERILDDLNANHRNITFKEASGVVPNLYINVTTNETSEGTRQDTADAYVTGMGKSGTLFQASSGQAPFVGLRDAVDHLSTDILRWIEGGWHHAAPCLREDGSVLSQ